MLHLIQQGGIKDKIVSWICYIYQINQEIRIDKREGVNFIRLITNAGQYTKDAFIGKTAGWPLFIISKYLLYPLFLGYMVEIYRGKMPSTSENPYEFIEGEELWGGLFFNGIKALVIKILYATPIALIIGPVIILYLFGDTNPVDLIGSGMFGLSEETTLAIGTIGSLFVFLYTIILAFSLPVGLIRFARRGNFFEAFKMVDILGHIGKIGRVNYFLAIVLLIVIISGAEYLLVQVPHIGWGLLFAFTPVLAVFSARYVTLLYEEGLCE